MSNGIGGSGVDEATGASVLFKMAAEAAPVFLPPDIEETPGGRTYLSQRVFPGLRVDVRFFCLLALCDFSKGILSIYDLKILLKVVHHLDILKQHQL